MDRWLGKVAVVTGAGSGIGAAITIDLIKSGLTVVGLDLNVDNIELIKTGIPASKRNSLFALKCDVSQVDDVKNVFSWIDQNIDGGIAVCVTCAGVQKMFKLIDADNADAINNIVNTNLLGPVWCARESFQSMQKHNFDGHIILINSILGHTIPMSRTGNCKFNIYPSSKYGITAVTEVLRQELLAAQTKIKVTV